MWALSGLEKILWRKENVNPLQYSCLGNSMHRGSLVGYCPWGSKKSLILVTKQQQQNMPDI